VLFSSASKNETLDLVNQDMLNLKQIIDKREKFREFLANVSFKRE
jgi:F0F1-type ATP synthase delta subunit